MNKFPRCKLQINFQPHNNWIKCKLYSVKYDNYRHLCVQKPFHAHRMGMKIMPPVRGHIVGQITPGSISQTVSIFTLFRKIAAALLQQLNTAPRSKVLWPGAPTSETQTSGFPGKCVAASREEGIRFQKHRCVLRHVTFPLSCWNYGAPTFTGTTISHHTMNLMNFELRAATSTECVLDNQHAVLPQIVCPCARVGSIVIIFWC